LLSRRNECIRHSSRWLQGNRNRTGRRCNGVLEKLAVLPTPTRTLVSLSKRTFRAISTPPGRRPITPGGLLNAAGLRMCLQWPAKITRGQMLSLLGAGATALASRRETPGLCPPACQTSAQRWSGGMPNTSAWPSCGHAVIMPAMHFPLSPFENLWANVASPGGGV
jgi:hypothetical protein